MRYFNAQGDADCITFGRKAMIITVLPLNTNGVWEVTSQLQEIIRKHSAAFDASRCAHLEGSSEE